MLPEVQRREALELKQGKAGRGGQGSAGAEQGRAGQVPRQTGVFVARLSRTDKPSTL